MQLVSSKAVPSEPSIIHVKQEVPFQKWSASQEHTPLELSKVILLEVAQSHVSGTVVVVKVYTLATGQLEHTPLLSLYYPEGHAFNLHPVYD